MCILAYVKHSSQGTYTPRVACRLQSQEIWLTGCFMLWPLPQPAGRQLPASRTKYSMLRLVRCTDHFPPYHEDDASHQTTHLAASHNDVECSHLLVMYRRFALYKRSLANEVTAACHTHIVQQRRALEARAGLLYKYKSNGQHRCALQSTQYSYVRQQGPHLTAGKATCCSFESRRLVVCLA